MTECPEGTIDEIYLSVKFRWTNQRKNKICLFGPRKIKLLGSAPCTEDAPCMNILSAISSPSPLGANISFNLLPPPPPSKPKNRIS